MNKVNFDSLTNYKAPEDWIKNAAAIPETVERKPTVVPFWKSRALITAASLVMVSALSLLLYLSFGNKPPVEVKSSSPATEIIWSTDENGETVATEIVIVEDGTTVQNGTLPTEEKSDIERIIDQIFGTESTSTTTATGRGRTDPTTKTTSPDNKTNSTEGGRTNPTTKSDPAEDDPVSTEAPAPPTDPPKPTDPPEIQVPTEAAAGPAMDCRIYTTVRYPEGVETPQVEDPAIYCHYYDASGSLVGSYSRFATQRVAEVLSYNTDGSMTVTYDPLESGLPIERGRYEYVFVDMSGMVLYRGTVQY